MVEVQQVHLVLAIPLLHMSLLEGQHLEVEVAVAEIPLLLIDQGMEIEEVELMEMVMDEVVQEMAQEVDEEMVMVMEMEMEMETVKKKTIKVKLLVIEDLLDHKALQVFKAQQVYKVFKVYRDPLDPKDYRVCLALMVGKAFKETMDLLENEALEASVDKEVLQFTYQELLHQIWSIPNGTTLDTTGLENTFQAVGTAMSQLAQQQQVANAQLNQSLQQQQERGQIVAIMDKVASATLQSSYDSIFASIPVYDGSDTKEFWSWLHRIEAACSYTKRNP